jgi:hypothetical protein
MELEVLSGMAVKAVNKGNIFRFLLKPCPSDDLIMTAKVMVDILAMLDPNTCDQANRLRNAAREMSKALEIEDHSWEVELAAILCRMGQSPFPMIFWPDLRMEAR